MNDQQAREVMTTGELRNGMTIGGLTIGTSNARCDVVRELAWLPGDFDALTDEQLSVVVDSVRDEMRKSKRSRQRAVGRVCKERRRGATKRVGWRWVVYLKRDETMREVAQAKTRGEALAELRRHLAHEEYDLRRAG